MVMMIITSLAGIANAGESTWTFQVIGDGQVTIQKNGEYEGLATPGDDWTMTFNTNDKIDIISLAYDGSTFFKLCDNPQTECRYGATNSVYSDSITATAGSYTMITTFVKNEEIPEIPEATPIPIVTPAPTPSPTPTATPSPTPSPTPTPTPIPTPTPTPIPEKGIIKIDIPAPTPTPEPQVMSYSSPFGTIRFNSTPMGADVYIDGEKLPFKTPTSRDLALGGYNISIILDGYVAYDESVIVRNRDDVTIDVMLQAVEPEVTPEVVMSVAIPEVNGSITGTTRNESNATIASQPNNDEISFVWIVIGGLAIVATGLLGGFLLKRKTMSSQDLASGEDDIGEVADNPNTVEEQKRKILSIIKNNPVDTTDEEILEKLQEIYSLKISGRTLTRRKAELKAESKI